MIKEYEGIRFLAGTTDILIAAPHAPIIDGVYQNDVRTGIIAEEIQRELGCCAIINDRFFKPKGEVKKSFDNFFLDLFRIDHSGKVPGYLERIRQIVDSEGKTLVVWVHGIADDKTAAIAQEHIDRGLFDQEPAMLHALIGYGQGKDPKTGDDHDLLTAAHYTAQRFAALLTAEGMTTQLTHKDGWNYRGRDAKRLNQWFNHQGYGFDAVESIQLEITEQGHRDSRENAENTARIIARALSELVRSG